MPQTRSPLPNGRYLPCSRNINHYPTQTSPEYKSGKQLLPDPALPESYHVSYFTCIQTMLRWIKGCTDIPPLYNIPRSSTLWIWPPSWSLSLFRELIDKIWEWPGADLHIQAGIGRLSLQTEIRSIFGAKNCTI